jgi:membrane protein implicated in regulation of membrane protease activity
MTAFIEFWNALVLGQQIFLCIAIPATLLLIILIVMMLVGFGNDDVDGDTADEFDGESDADATDGDTRDAGLSFFTLRGIVSMFSIMGWSGLIFLDAGMGLPVWAGVAISVALGLLTLFLVALAMRGISRLQSSGNLDLRNAIGKVGQVYLTIPADGASAGKVNLTVQEQFKEFSAITTAKEPIKTGAYVRVVSVSESGVLLVEPINKNK